MSLSVDDQVPKLMFNIVCLFSEVPRCRSQLCLSKVFGCRWRQGYLSLAAPEHQIFVCVRTCIESNQIKVYLSRAPNTTGVVDLTVKCLLTGSNQWCEEKKGVCVCVLVSKEIKQQ